jgi:hypothetical protein
MNFYFDRDTKPIALERYVELMKDDDYRRVNETTIETSVGPVWVSTIWLGINHQWIDGYPPQIFETMVFDQGDYADSPWSDLECERYSTIVQAIAGHDQIVESIRSKVTLMTAEEEGAGS